MQVFLSYAAEDRQVAEEICLALAGAGHSVFFDKESLPAGGDYHSRIRSAVQQSDVLVFLISPDSVAMGAYALTEIKYARQQWASPTARVLPVIVRPTPWETIPSYLKAVTVLVPEGNISAELVVAVAAMRGEPHLGKHEPQVIVSAVEPAESFLGDTGQMSEVAFSPDGRTLATWGIGFGYNAVHLWDAERRCLRHKLPPPDGYCLPTFSPDGAMIVAATDRGRIMTWRVSDGKHSVVWDPGPDTSLWPGTTFAISPDGKTLFTAGEDRLLVLSTANWHLLDNVPLSTIADDQVNRLVFSPNGTTIAVVLPTMVKLISVQDWRTLQVYEDKLGDMLDDAAFSGDGALLALTSSGRRTVSIWIVSNAERIDELPGHIGGVVNPKFFGGSKVLITGGLCDGFVRFWRVGEDEPLVTIRAAAEGIRSLDVSADLSTLATGGYEGQFRKSIRLWHIR